MITKCSGVIVYSGNDSIIVSIKMCTIVSNKPSSIEGFISISANSFCGLLFSFTSQNVSSYSGNVFKWSSNSI